MISYCVWHKVHFPQEVNDRGEFIIGLKEPLSNPERTDGMCQRCREKEEEINNAKPNDIKQGGLATDTGIRVNDSHSNDGVDNTIERK